MSAQSVSKRISKGPAISNNNRDIVSAAPCIVGIGASAGGYQAIRHFFEAMPADSGVAFVIVQHLAPTHTSLAAELIAKFTTMPVHEAMDGELAEANHVYTSPSDKEITVKAGHLCLTPREDRHQLHLPIDHFFNSLGEDCQTRAIGVVLSGGGTDGTLGLKTIAASEGIVLVQDPATAEFDSMPKSAIATGVANYVLTVEKMPKVILDYTRHPYVISKIKATTEDEVAEDTESTRSLIKIIQTKCGYDFSGYKRSTFLRRIQRRMGLHGILRQTKYVDFLKNNTDEVDALFRDLLIGVTEFFRDQDAWKILTSQAITPLVQGKTHDEPIRIWIPGCSTGEEAYTMAMIVMDRLRQARKKCPVQIFATDTNNEALEVGRIGRYPAGIATRISPARLRHYFDAGPDKQYYVVNAELRAAVVFGLQNIFADPPFGRVDLISCRNVLIYIESELQKRVLNIFHFALRRDGYLFLGSAESNGGRDDLFKPVSKIWRVFQREGTTKPTLLSLPLPIHEQRTTGIAPPLRTTSSLSLVASIAQKLVLERFSPASVLINGHNEALYYCGETDEFLVRPRGAPTQDILLMVREGLRSRLRAALQEAATTLLTVEVSGARMKRGNAFMPIQITVTPTSTGDLGQLFLVVFRHDLQPSIIPIDKNAKGTLVRHLEEELQATRDDLLATFERFESATDELKTSNEEVISTNQELRSSNEELESSKEELQSLNEELSTVNQQLEAKLRELEMSNSDLHNLLISSDIATICLDQSLRIKWFAPAAEKQFHLIKSDIGRPISDLLAAMEDTGLIAAAHAILAKQNMADQEFQVDNGRWYIRRALPYQSEHAQIDGIILTYTDITDIHLANESASRSRSDLSETIERNDQLKTLSAALALAEERERRTLAKYLHDDLGQILAVIALKAVTVKKQKMPNPVRIAMEDCTAAIEQANGKLREMALQLNPPMLDQLGFVTALEWMSDEIHRVYHLDVLIEDDGLPKPMAPAVSATMFRAVRELLTNVSKHAKVEKAVVKSSRSDDNTLVVTVSDAGAGFNAEATVSDKNSEALGLISMRERMNLLGGDISIKSNPGDGTTVIIRAPLLSTESIEKSPAQKKIKREKS